MVELVAKTPCEGLLPLTIGTGRLEEVIAGPLTSISPLGDEAALSKALKAKHKIALPDVGQMTEAGGVRCLWFGRGEVLLMGAAPDPSLADHAAVVDQSDAWACVALSGPPSEAALARLVPVDMRAAHFAPGSAIRTQLQHLNVAIARTGTDSFLILAFRAMAHTLVHDLKTGLEHVAARG